MRKIKFGFINDKRRGPRKPRFSEKVNDGIAKHYAKGWTLQDIADKYGCSTTYVMTTARKYFGKKAKRQFL